MFFRRINIMRRHSILPVFHVVLAVSLVPSVALAQKDSLRPGINKNFEKPDVAQWIKRFEREGRDVYDKRDEIVSACKIEPGMSVADVGAGTGLFTYLFSPAVGSEGRVYAVDIAKEFVESVEQRCKEAGLKNVLGVVCTPEDTNLPPNSVDRVFICDTYHHFEFPYKTMASIYRSLRPGGQVALIDFERIEGASSDWTLKHVRGGKEVFAKEIEDAGFKLVEEKDLFKDKYFLRFEKVLK
jgi:ubiquinone/menaquinone biosynthesis C-methylase UbiE